MKYQHRDPVDAEQFTKDHKPDGVVQRAEGHHTAETMMGHVIVNENDWVVTFPAGDRDVIPDDEFVRDFELVPGQEQPEPEQDPQAADATDEDPAADPATDDGDDPERDMPDDDETVTGPEPEEDADDAVTVPESGT